MGDYEIFYDKVKNYIRENQGLLYMPYDNYADDIIIPTDGENRVFRVEQTETAAAEVVGIKKLPTIRVEIRKVISLQPMEFHDVCLQRIISSL